MQHFTRPRTWTDPLVQHMQGKLKNWDEEVWTGLIWLRIGTGGGRL